MNLKEGFRQWGAALSAVIVLALVPSFAAQAVEKQQLCVKQGGGKSYKVEASIYEGGELNDAMKTSRFTSFAKYVVIFWQQDQVSIIELSFRNISSLGTEGTDQQGRTWDISTSSICF